MTSSADGGPDSVDGRSDSVAGDLETPVLERVADALAERVAAAVDPRVTVGENAVLVDLSHPDHGRLAGLAHRPPGEVAAAGPDTDSVPRLAGLATEAATRPDRAVGVATLNALSRPDVDWRTGDPMAALPADVDTVATVGLFRPALARFAGASVRVIERDPPETVDAPEGVSVETFTPDACTEAFAGTDLCFLTGSALVYGGFERYLSTLSSLGVAPVVLVGATASFLPGPLFDAGVDVVAGARVIDRERVRDRVAAGDCASGLHDAGVEKVYVRPGGDGTGPVTDESATAGERLSDQGKAGERPGGGRTAATDTAPHEHGDSNT